MNANELSRPKRCLGETRDRQGRGIRCEYGIVRNDCFRFGRHVGFDLSILEHGFDDQLTAGQVVV